MRCDHFLFRFDELEPGRRLSPWLAFHLSRCPSCRAQVNAFQSALEAWKRDEAERFDGYGRLPDMEDRAMAAVRLTVRPKRELTLAQWVFPGLLIASSCVGLPVFAKIHGVGDDGLFFPLALVFGIGLTALGSVFVGSHADELKAELERRRAGMSELMRR